MKRNKFFMLGIVTVLVAVLSLTFVSNTFAKYTSTVSGSDTARVAKWEWAFSGDASGDDHSATFDVFTLDVYNLNSAGNVVLNVDDANVANGSSTPIIAPGTGGVTQFRITNNSEVTGTYSISFSANEDGVPLYWSLDNENWTTDITTLNIFQSVKFESCSAKLISLYWKWDFYTGKDQDLADTQLGINLTAEPKVTVNVLFTQVD